MRLIDNKMYIYCQEVETKTGNIKSDAFFIINEQTREFKVHYPNSGNNDTNHKVVTGASNESKKDTQTHLFYYYIGSLKMKLNISTEDLKDVITSSKNNNPIENSKSFWSDIVGDVDDVVGDVENVVDNWNSSDTNFAESILEGFLP
jgi:hypothetical protein